MSLTSNIAFVRSLAPKEWFYILEAWVILFWCNIYTRLRDYSYWRFRLLNAMSQKQSSRANSNMEEAYRLRKIFNAALRLQFLPTNCLRRSLALHTFLQRRHVQCSLRIGTKMIDGLLHGHAWLEHAGVVLNDQNHIPVQYTPFPGENLQQIAFSK